MSERPLRLAVALNGYGLDHWAEDGGHRDILPWDDLRGLAQQAEGLGFERIFVPEIGGREAFSTLAGLGLATDHIGLATGVVRLDSPDTFYVSRGLTTLGMAASSLDEMVDGRLTLGVGSSASIDRTRKLLRALREVVAGGEGFISEPELTWASGQTHWVMAPRRVPIFLAALGPRMVSLAGEVADGAILNWCTPERVARAREAIPRRDGFTLAVYVRLCLSPVDHHAAEALKVAVSRYIPMPHYRRQFELMGLGPLVDQALRGAEIPLDPVGRVPDELVEAVCISGDPAQARGRLDEYGNAGADLVVVYPVPARDAVSSITGTMMAAAPEA